LTHRGGVDADGASGDGAGLLTSLPDAFFRARAQEQGIALPEVLDWFCIFPGGVCERCTYRGGKRLQTWSGCECWDGGAFL